MNGKCDDEDDFPEEFYNLRIRLREAAEKRSRRDRRRRYYNYRHEEDRRDKTQKRP